MAERCGLSVVTVSHVLNAGRAASFRPATVEKIRLAAQELGYQLNASARAMRLGRTNQISLLTPSVHSRGLLITALLDGILDAIHEQFPHLHLMLGESTEAQLENEDNAPKVIRNKVVDGLLVNYHKAMPTLVKAIQHYGIPALFLNLDLERDALLPDDYQNAFDLTSHLLASGRKRVAYFDLLSPPLQNAHYSRRERLAGYRAAMAEHGRSERVLVWENDLGDVRNPQFPMQEFLDIIKAKNRPDAAVCYGSQSLMLSLHAATRHGLRLPEDFLLSTFEVDDLGKKGMPVLTSLLPFYEIGRDAVSALYSKISGSKKQFRSKRFLATISQPTSLTL